MKRAFARRATIMICYSRAVVQKFDVLFDNVWKIIDDPQQYVLNNSNEIILSRNDDTTHPSPSIGRWCLINRCPDDLYVRRRRRRASVRAGRTRFSKSFFNQFVFFFLNGVFLPYMYEKPLKVGVNVKFNHCPILLNLMKLFSMKIRRRSLRSCLRYEHENSRFDYWTCEEIVLCSCK